MFSLMFASYLCVVVFDLFILWKFMISMSGDVCSTLVADDMCWDVSWGWSGDPRNELEIMVEILSLWREVPIASRVFFLLGTSTMKLD